MAFSSATGALAPTTLHTSADGLAQGEFRLPTKSGEIDAYFARPEEGDNLPIVLVVQEIFGLHEHIRDVVRRVAKLGYFAVAANLYERQGDASRYTDIPALVADLVSKVPDEQVHADLDACVAWAGEQGGDVTRVGVTGFCWGGRLTWMYAEHNPSVRAGVAWYGRLQRARPVDQTQSHRRDGALEGTGLGFIRWPGQKHSSGRRRTDAGRVDCG